MKTKSKKTTSSSKRLSKPKAIKNVKPLSRDLNPQPLPPLKVF
jgi:hypothetical protein